MSRFLRNQAAALSPYTPGEQPRDKRYIKLNTNECPYPPAPGVQLALGQSAQSLRLYPDPEAKELKEAFADFYGVSPSCVFVSNGSDETLAFAFFAFFDRGDEVFFPDPSYGFYPVYAGLCGLKARPVPLNEDFTISHDDFAGLTGNIVIANPNAPTGIALSRDEIEAILAANPGRLVITDEAYCDFADGVSSVPLLKKYDNLLVIRTFSKSRSLAGMRVGYALGNPELIAALERIKYSFNPYNLSRAGQAAGIAALADHNYFARTVEMVKATREKTTASLAAIGVRVLPSQTNFLFAAHHRLSGRELYLNLRENGILVRYFEHPRTQGFVRISIGSDAEMETLVSAMQNII